ncbi:hypothetical protein KDL29_12515 [bacterium]|nr:hypothetical protein [bacterium]UNM09102.1 MAG: hypothetical protein H7A35_03410 [Planctomycetales bacterium]
MAGSTAEDEQEPAFEERPDIAEFLEMEQLLALTIPPVDPDERAWLTVLQLSQTDPQAALTLFDENPDAVCERGHAMQLLSMCAMYGNTELLAGLLPRMERRNEIGTREMDELLGIAARYGDRIMALTLADSGAGLDSYTIGAQLDLDSAERREFYHFLATQCGLSNSKGGWEKAIAEFLPLLDHDELAALLEDGDYFQGRAMFSNDILLGCMDDSRKLQLLMERGYAEALRQPDSPNSIAMFWQAAMMWPIGNSESEQAPDLAGCAAVLAKAGFKAEEASLDNPAVRKPAEIAWLAALDPRLASVLPELGIDPLLADERGYTALHGVSWFPWNTAESIESLLDAGMDPLQADKQGFSPLHLAIINQRPELWQLMLEHVEQPDAASLGAIGRIEEYSQALADMLPGERIRQADIAMILAGSADSQDILRQLLELGDEPPLQALILADMPEELALRLENGEYSIWPLPDYEPLRLATGAKRLDCLQALLADDAIRAAVTDEQFHDLLEAASYNEDPAVLKALLDSGLDDCQPGAGRQAQSLGMAISRGRVDMLRLMLDAGFDPNDQLSYDQQLGIWTGGRLLEYCLPRAGANSRDQRAGKELEMLRLLVEHGLRADYYLDSNPYRGGGTYVPLIERVGLQPSAEVLDLLLEAGLDLDAGTLVPGQPMQPPVARGLLPLVANLPDVEDRHLLLFLPEQNPDEMLNAMLGCIRRDNAAQLELLASQSANTPDSASTARLYREAFVQRSRACIDSMLRLGFALPGYRDCLNAMVDELD